METGRHRRRTRRARHVPDHIPRGGHVEDAEHDQREHRTAARAERPEQDHPRGAEGGGRARGPLPGPDSGRGRSVAAVGRGRPDPGDDDGCGGGGRPARADHRARRPGLGQNVGDHGRVPAVHGVVRRRRRRRPGREDRAVLGRHAPGLVQPGTVADHLRTADVRAATERAVRAAGRVVRPAVRQRLVPDAAQAVRGRVPRVHAGAVRRRPAPAQPARLGHRGRPVLAAGRAAGQRARAVHHAVYARRAQDDAAAEGPVPRARVVRAAAGRRHRSVPVLPPSPPSHHVPYTLFLLLTLSKNRFEQGPDGSGQVRTGLDLFGQVRTVLDRFEPVRRGLDMFGQVWNGSDRFRPVRTGSDQFGQVQTS